MAKQPISNSKYLIILTNIEIPGTQNTFYYRQEHALIQNFFSKIDEKIKKVFGGLQIYGHQGAMVDLFQINGPASGLSCSWADMKSDLKTKELLKFHSIWTALQVCRKIASENKLISKQSAYVLILGANKIDGVSTRYVLEAKCVAGTTYELNLLEREDSLKFSDGSILVS